MAHAQRRHRYNGWHLHSYSEVIRNTEHSKEVWDFVKDCFHLFCIQQVDKRLIYFHFHPSEIHTRTHTHTYSILVVSVAFKPLLPLFYGSYITINYIGFRFHWYDDVVLVLRCSFHTPTLHLTLYTCDGYNSLRLKRILEQLRNGK